jgi:hypothetical protein
MDNIKKIQDKNYKDNFKYYQKQIKKLHGSCKVKFTSENGETNWLDLNKATCQAIAKTISELSEKKQITVYEGY